MTEPLELRKEGIEMVVEAIQTLLAFLFEFQKQMESEENIDDARRDHIDILRLRIDTLCKLDSHLLKPLMEELSLILNSAENLKKEDLFKIIDARNDKLFRSMLQGIMA